MRGKDISYTCKESSNKKAIFSFLLVNKDDKKTFKIFTTFGLKYDKKSFKRTSQLTYARQENMKVNGSSKAFIPSIWKPIKIWFNDINV